MRCSVVLSHLQRKFQCLINGRSTVRIPPQPLQSRKPPAYANPNPSRFKQRQPSKESSPLPIPQDYILFFVAEAKAFGIAGISVSASTIPVIRFSCHRTEMGTVKRTNRRRFAQSLVFWLDSYFHAPMRRHDV